MSELFRHYWVSNAVDRTLSIMLCCWLLLGLVVVSLCDAEAMVDLEQVSLGHSKDYCFVSFKKVFLFDVNFRSYICASDNIMLCSDSSSTNSIDLDPTPSHAERRHDSRRSGSGSAGLRIVVANQTVCSCTNMSLILDCQSRVITSLHLSTALNGLPISAYCPRLTEVYARSILPIFVGTNLMKHAQMENVFFFYSYYHECMHNLRRYYT